MHSDQNDTPLLRPRMLAGGSDDHQIRSAGYHRVRHGAYLDPSVWEQLDLESRHRMLIAATVPKLTSGAAVSHASAAIWRRQPLIGPPPSVVHITRGQAAGGFRRGVVHAHVGLLPAGDLDVVDDVLVTTVGRTTHDCARTLDFATAVCLMDDALRRGLTSRDEQLDRVAASRGRHGCSRARRVVAFADGRSESPGESLSRVSIAAAGLPAPTLQYEIWEGGVLVARTDFCWEAQRLIGEFDGRLKYGRLLRPGEDPGDVVYREKVREDAVRGLDYRFVRWGWEEARRPEVLGALIRRALERSRRAG